MLAAKKSEKLKILGLCRWGNIDDCAANTDRKREDNFFKSCRDAEALCASAACGRRM